MDEPYVEQALRLVLSRLNNVKRNKIFSPTSRYL
jgi:hypothetical protein